MGLWLSSRGSPGLSEPLCQGRRWAWLSLRGGPALIPTNGHTGPLPWEDEGSPPASPGPGLLALPRFQTGLRWAETLPIRWLRLTHSGPPTPAKIYDGRVLQTSPVILWSLVLIHRVGHPEESQGQKGWPCWPRAAPPSVIHHLPHLRPLQGTLRSLEHQEACAHTLTSKLMPTPS